VFIVLAIGPMFVGSNLAKSNVFLRAIKIHSRTSFGGEVKLLVPCHKILLHVIDPLRYVEILTGKIQWLLHTQFLPSSLLGVCCNQSKELRFMNRE
jgi:hypothetical protein